MSSGRSPFPSRLFRPCFFLYLVRHFHSIQQMLATIWFWANQFLLCSLGFRRAGFGGLVITPSESDLRAPFSPSLSPPFFLVYADFVLVLRWFLAAVGLVWRIGDHTILVAVFAPSLFGLTGPFFSHT